jgi:DNA-binding NarL/FixJ family response regulator
MNIQVAVVAKHRLIGSAIGALLEDMRNIRVMAIGGSVSEVAKSIRSKPPNIFLILEDALIDHADLPSELSQISPDVPLIVIVGEPLSGGFWQRLRASTVSVVLKDASKTELYHAINTVRDGGRYLSPEVAEHVMDFLTDNKGSTARDRELTARQQEILRLLAQGYATKEIANRLNLSPRTIESHRSRMMQRLGVRHLAGLIQYAIRTGIITPGQEY